MSPAGDRRQSRMGDIMSAQKFLRRKAASEYLHETHGLDRAPSTLAKLAVTGGGPTFRRMGRVPIYTPQDLDAWVEFKLSPRMHSTSQVAPNGVAAAARCKGELQAVRGGASS